MRDNHWSEAELRILEIEDSEALSGFKSKVYR